MKKNVLSQYFWRHLLILTIFLMVNPYILVAQEHEYKGYYSKELKNKIDEIKLKIYNNLESYKKDKLIVHLDESHNLVIQAINDFRSYSKLASQKKVDTSNYDNYQIERLKFRLENSEFDLIRYTEFPYLCNQLHEIGQLYIDADKKKARQCFRDIIIRFTSDTFKDCNKKAEFALEDLK